MIQYSIAVLTATVTHGACLQFPEQMSCAEPGHGANTSVNDIYCIYINKFVFGLSPNSNMIAVNHTDYVWGKQTLLHIVSLLFCSVRWEPDGSAAAELQLN